MHIGLVSSFIREKTTLREKVIIRKRVLTVYQSQHQKYVSSFFLFFTSFFF